MKGCEKMYESYSRQALPDRKYREILGAALYVFNSNYDFLIENILHIKDPKCQFKLENRRNRIVHSFTATSDHDSHKQVLCSLDPKTKEQKEITEADLLEFIKENEAFALQLDKFRNEILNKV